MKSLVSQTNLFPPPAGTPPNCVDIDECEAAPCENGGTCVDGENRYECLCPLGYQGGLASAA